MLTVVYEIAWLFVVLPLMEAAHLRFFQTMHKGTAHESRFFGWYLEFLRVLKRTPAHEAPLYIALARKGLLFGSLVLPLVGFSFFIEGSFSVLFILSVLLCFGLIDLMMGFTFNRHFISLSALEKSGVRQGLILIILTALLVSPLFDINKSIQDLVLDQTASLYGSVPRFGAFVNPLAFLCVLFATSLYLRHWDDAEFPRPDSLRKPLQSELFGIDLLSYKIARTLEHLLIYTLIVYVFLGGPHNGASLDGNISFTSILALFTVKVIFVACAVLSTYFITPRLQDRQTLRLFFLVLWPLEFVSYALSQFFLTYFN